MPDLTQKFGYKSPMQVPRITKITLNMGVGEAIADKKVIDHAVGRHDEDRRPEAGGHQVEEGDRRLQGPRRLPIGCMVTLRGARMYEFLDRFVTIALPRVRDFRGISTRAFDGRGNYNIGVKEQIIFPEIDYDKIDALRGMNIAITTTAKTDDEGAALLAAFKFPFKTLRRPTWPRLALIQREQKRRRPGRQVRQEARRAEGDHRTTRKQSDEERYAARARAAEAAAQRLPDAPAQPLRADRPPARHVPQVRPGRNKIRELAFKGDIPGVIKASW